MYQKLTITTKDAAERMRLAGVPISERVLKAGISQGVYTFGEVIAPEEGLLQGKRYAVYSKLLDTWLEERGARRVSAPV